MYIGLMSNDDGKEHTKYIKNCLEEQNHIVKYINEDSSFSNDIDLLDCAVSIGGDGTVLKLAKLVGEIPILGINHGHLGFLTDMERSKFFLQEIFRRIKNKQYILDKRARLDAMVIGDNGSPLNFVSALNDIVIKGAVAKICKLSTFVDSKFVAKFSADGIIISTATGSTGYSLSAGGPIIPPDMPANVITPICSHTLNARSIVVSNEHTIEIHIDSYHPNLLVSADGQWDIEIKSGESVLITKSKITTNLIRIQNKPFFEIMSTKLGWNYE